MTRLRRVCVFCGANPGGRREYAAAAALVGRTLAERGIALVYGGGSVGLMGAVADAALAAGGEVVGVIPHALATKELLHAGLTDLRVVQSMHERKALMTELSDAFVGLPGGVGTLEELFEVTTWSQLGIHRKPIGLLNVCGYYDGLVRFLEHAIAEGFVGPELRERLLVGEEAGPLLDALARHEIPPTQRWIQADET